MQCGYVDYFGVDVFVGQFVGCFQCFFDLCVLCDQGDIGIVVQYEVYVQWQGFVVIDDDFFVLVVDVFGFYVDYWIWFVDCGQQQVVGVLW